MKRWISISKDNIDSVSNEYLKNKCIVLYGAGGNGIRLLGFLEKHGIAVQYFCDDDFNKWDTEVQGISVIPFEKLNAISANGKNKEIINVILTSVFSGPILKKLKKVENVHVFEPFAILTEEFFPKSFYNTTLNATEKNEILKKFEKIIPVLQDDESKKVMSVIRDVISNQENAGNRTFIEIASEEDCYFIPEVCRSLPDHPTIIDCGGFTGDLMVALKKHNIDYDKVYSFEPNPCLFDEMCKNVKNNNLVDRFIPIHKGVWDSEGMTCLSFEEDDIAGGKIGAASGTSVETISIDKFCEEHSVDFIKMDIEGAELPALRGGGGCIKRDRPILAISLYHSPHDVVDIPEYLLNELENYKFIVRHHSFIGSETVLYAIPTEKIC